jgi:hypothetical protein
MFDPHKSQGTEGTSRENRRKDKDATNQASGSTEKESK